LLTWIRSRAWRRARRRGVSEVVATILLLGMTITLFASIFLFTNRNPSAQPQSLTQFTVALTYGGSGGLQVTEISITHLSGTVLTGSGTSQVAIYVVSQKHPTSIPSPFALSAGLGGASIWGFDQVWNISLASYGITSPDNLTVSIVAHDLLEFRETVFAVVPSAAPYFASVKLTPATIGPKASFSFNLSAVVEFGSSSGDTVKVNLTESSGSASLALTGSGSSGLYYYNDASSPLTSPNPASATTYYFFLTATDASGQRSSYAVAFTVT
jgi:flagellin-like protein